MSHACRACVVHCMDFRIQETVNNLLQSLGIKNGDFDRVSVAGGAANVEQLKRHIELSRALHGPSVFILTIHEDCGAGAKKEDLQIARELIRSSYPECETRTFLIKKKSDDAWEWEEK